MTLHELKDEFLKRPMADMRPIEVRNSGNRMSMIMYRQPPFQVELVIWMPGAVIPAHRHPNIDLFALPVSGGLVLIVGDTETKVNHLLGRAKTWAAEKLSSGGAIRIDSGDWHGGKAGKSGASFWTFQKWADDAEITAAGIDWLGDPLPPVLETAIMA